MTTTPFTVEEATNQQRADAVPNSTRFLDAFSEIEMRLRKMTGPNKPPLSFSEAVRIASASNSLVRSRSDDLQEFADLRNAIVHERRGSRVLAEPIESVVEEIEKLAALLLAPPTVGSKFQGKVQTLAPEEPIGRAVKLMTMNSYSQMPVYQEKKFAGLLTTNTITRWLGKNADDDYICLMETAVGAVLQYAERKNEAYFFGRQQSVADALECFLKYEERGERLEAILITENGKPTETPIGIITIWDLSSIYELLGIKKGVR